MKKLHEIKIIYISKKKKKIQRENKFSNRRRRRNFVTVWRRCLPRSERIACAFEKPEWTQSRASCPLRGDLPPLQRNTTVPRPDSQFVFTAKANLASVHSSDARLLDTTNIVARFQASLYALVSSSFLRYFTAGMGRRDPANNDRMNRRHMMMENAIESPESYLEFKRQFVRSMNPPSFQPMRINANRLIHGSYIISSNSLFLPSCDKYNVSKRYLM